jgi:hypothetical protein
LLPADGSARAGFDVGVVARASAGRVTALLLLPPPVKFVAAGAGAAAVSRTVDAAVRTVPVAVAAGPDGGAVGAETLAAEEVLAARVAVLVVGAGSGLDAATGVVGDETGFGAAAVAPVEGDGARTAGAVVVLCGAVGAVAGALGAGALGAGALGVGAATGVEVAGEVADETGAVA